MYLKLLLASLMVVGVFLESQDADDDAEEYVSMPITHTTYKRILKSSPLVFVKFFAPWCYYSQQMFDDWESLGEAYANDSRVLIAEMNCDPSPNKKICRKFDVDRYPMIFMFKDGVQGELYDRKRNKKSFIKYVEKFLKKSDTDDRDEA